MRVRSFPIIRSTFTRKRTGTGALWVIRVATLRASPSRIRHRRRRRSRLRSRAGRLRGRRNYDGRILCFEFQPDQFLFERRHLERVSPVPRVAPVVWEGGIDWTVSTTPVNPPSSRRSVEPHQSGRVEEIVIKRHSSASQRGSPWTDAEGEPPQPSEQYQRGPPETPARSAASVQGRRERSA